MRKIVALLILTAGLLTGCGEGVTMTTTTSAIRSSPAASAQGSTSTAGKPAGASGGFRHGDHAGGGAARFSTPTAKHALTKFASCLRTNGIKVPEPNTSGKGPIFNAEGLGASSAKFAAAESKCRSDLRAVFAQRPGAGGAPSSGNGG